MVMRSAPSPDHRTLWQSGILLTACNLLVALGSYAFQCLIGRLLPLEEHGYANVSTGMVLLLTLPVVLLIVVAPAAVVLRMVRALCLRRSAGSEIAPLSLAANPLSSPAQ